MNCPYCNNIETKVIDSRESKDGSSIKRRRECEKCEKRFSTVEKVLKLDLEVKKSTGAIEEFNLQKIKNSLLKSCEKRPVTLEQIERVLEQIMQDLKEVEGSVIPTTTVGKIVLKNLRKLDEIAFLKFAIVHNDYSTLDEFMGDIDAIARTHNINLHKSA
jgi:transcriptional repressor NrdR